MFEAIQFEAKTHASYQVEKIYRRVKLKIVMKDGREVDASSGFTEEIVGVGKGRVKKC